MGPAKTWLAIPILAIICAGIGLAARHPTLDIPTAIALGALGAATAAAVRAFAGPSLAAALAAGTAALLAVMSLLALAPPDLIRAALAGAAALFAISELARPLPPDASPWPALGAALSAVVLDPSYVGLLPIAGIRLMTGPWSRPRWSIAIPIAGGLAVALAALAVVLRSGALADLWQLWGARPEPAASPLAVLTATGDLLNPVTTVVAAAGIGVCTLRGRIPASAALAVCAGAVALDLATRTQGSATLVVAALGAGAAIARFAALIRIPSGQAFVGATVGFMLVVVPAWLLAAP